MPSQQAMDQIAQIIEAEMKPPWTYIATGGFPEKPGKYLVRIFKYSGSRDKYGYEKITIISHYNKGADYFLHTEEGNRATHWMPMPEPPVNG